MLARQQGPAQDSEREDADAIIDGSWQTVVPKKFKRRTQELDAPPPRHAPATHRRNAFQNHPRRYGDPHVTADAASDAPSKDDVSAVVDSQISDAEAAPVRLPNSYASKLMSASSRSYVTHTHADTPIPPSFHPPSTPDVPLETTPDHTVTHSHTHTQFHTHTHAHAADDHTAVPPTVDAQSRNPEENVETTISSEYEATYAADSCPVRIPEYLTGLIESELRVKDPHAIANLEASISFGFVPSTSFSPTQGSPVHAYHSQFQPPPSGYELSPTSPSETSPAATHPMTPPMAPPPFMYWPYNYPPYSPHFVPPQGRGHAYPPYYPTMMHHPYPVQYGGRGSRRGRYMADAPARHQTERRGGHP